MFEKKRHVIYKPKQFFFLLLYFPVFLLSQNDYEKVLIHYNDNEFSSAGTLVQNILKKNKDIAVGDRLKLLFTYSKILKEQGKIDSSYIYLERLKPLLEKTKSKDSTLLYYACKAELARFDHDKYILDKILKESEEWYNKNKNHSFNSDVLAYYYNRKAASFSQYHHGSKDTVDLIISLSNKVIKLENKIQDKSIVAYSLNEKAQSYNYSIDSVKGLAYYKEALKYSNDNNLFLPAADIAFNIGRYFGLRRQFNKSILYYEEAYVAAQKSKNLSQLASVSYHLSTSYDEVNDYKNAYKYKIIELEVAHKINKLKTSNLLRESENKLIFEKQSDIIKTKKKEVENTRKYLFLLLAFVLLVVTGIIILIIYFQKIKRKNITLKSLSNENNFLLSEANHRINNNLQLIIILIESQIKKTEKPQQSELKNILSKIDSIATLHRHLYRHKDKKLINSKDYLKEIILKFNNILKEHNINLDFKIDSIMLPTDMAMYFGLLLTELIINSIKHAFGNQKQKEISFLLTEENSLVDFKYSDNGKNSKDKDIKPKLIDKLCRQLKVKSYVDTKRGFLFTFKKHV